MEIEVIILYRTALEASAKEKSSLW